MIGAPKTKPDRGLRSVPKVPRGNVRNKYTFNDHARFSWRKIRTWPLRKICVGIIFVDASNVLSSKGVVRPTLSSGTRLPSGLGVEQAKCTVGHLPCGELKRDAIPSIRFLYSFAEMGRTLSLDSGDRDGLE